MALTISQEALDLALKLNEEARILIQAGKLREAEPKVAEAWAALANRRESDEK